MKIPARLDQATTTIRNRMGKDLQVKNFQLVNRCQTYWLFSPRLSSLHLTALLMSMERNSYRFGIDEVDILVTENEETMSYKDDNALSPLAQNNVWKGSLTANGHSKCCEILMETTIATFSPTRPYHFSMGTPVFYAFQLRDFRHNHFKIVKKAENFHKR